MKPHRVAALTTTVTVVAAFLLADVAMATVAGVAHFLLRGQLLLQWMLCVVVITAGGYLLFGWPQILAWERCEGTDMNPAHVGSKRVAKMLDGSSRLNFVLASIVGGPLAVGWYYGHRPDLRPLARKRTLESAIILAVVMSAIYVGVVSAVLGWLKH